MLHSYRNITPTSKAQLKYLVIFNSLFAIVVSLQYFEFMNFPEEFLTIFYLACAVIGQMSFLIALVGLCLIPTLFLKHQCFRHIAMASLMTLAICLLIADTLVFSQYRFHINTVILKLVFADDIVSIPLITYVKIIAVVFAVFATQLATLRFSNTIILWIKPDISRFKVGIIFSILIIISIISSHLIHAYHYAHGNSAITNITRYIPMYYPVTANSFLLKYGWIDPQSIAKKHQLMSTKKAANSPLNYPRQTLQQTAVKHKKDIVWIVIDSWRHDSFKPKIMPNTTQFSKNGCQLDNHYSTGNSTRTGIFGLFYGLPGSYWHSMLSNRQPPVFIERLQQLDYEMGIFASSQLKNPEFDRTVFSSIDNLRVKTTGSHVIDRDIAITSEWLEWNKKRDKIRPSFSFLFYDSPHAYAVPEDYPNKIEPMSDNIDYLNLNNNTDAQPLLNRYLTSIHMTDSLIAKVLTSLKLEGNLDNTIVLITSDHGQELNDNHLNYWGHNSNFTDVQVKVPLVIVGGTEQLCDRWNEQQSFTSHEDIIPSLMQQYLGVTSPISDYSTGISLFGNPIARQWLLASSYQKYAIISKESIIEVDSGFGSYKLYDKTNRLIDGKINPRHLKQAFNKMSLFLN